MLDVTKTWLERDYPDFRRRLLCARIVTVLLTFAGLLYVTWWAGRYLGERPAFFVALLGVFHPMLLAHGRLLTTDMPVAVFIALALGETTRWLVDKKASRAWYGALAATGAAVATKYSALLLPPFLVAAWAIAAYRKQGPFKRRPWHVWGRTVAALVAVLWFAICASFLFQKTGWTVKRILDERPAVNYLTYGLGNKLLRKYTPVAWLPEALPIPLPYTYLSGVASIERQNDDGGSSNWFAGERRPHGFFGYHAILLLLKSPLVLVGLWFGAFAFLAEWHYLGWRLGIWLAFPLAYLGLCAFSQINLGARHALPALLPLVLIGAHLLDRWWKRSREGGRALAVVFLVQMVLSTSLSLYDPTAYFNWLAGGRAGGHQLSIAGEDNMQDADRAARWLLARPEYHGGLPVYAVPYALLLGNELKWMGVNNYEFKCGNTKPPPGSFIVANRGRLWRDAKPCFPQIHERLLTVINDHIEIHEAIP